MRQRAGNRCEYCLLRQENSGLSHHVEHIIAKQHGGANDSSNLALACNRWPEHFEFVGPRVVGLTPSGRATIYVLAMNDERRVERRVELLARADIIV